MGSLGINGIPVLSFLKMELKEEGAPEPPLTCYKQRGSLSAQDRGVQANWPERG